jgi:pyridoxamine 5'-phosphate oxidase
MVKNRFRTKVGIPALSSQGNDVRSEASSAARDRATEYAFHVNERDPIQRLQTSLARALSTEPFDATRAALATADARAVPSVRFVLVKIIDDRGLVFFTHHESRKGHELAENPRAAIAFHWFSQGEQVRARGMVQRISEAESDAYFADRPRGSQLGAWASPQSQPIASRDVLEATIGDVTARFSGTAVPRPAFWGGYRLVPDELEFWHDRPDRLHDRLLYTRHGADWITTRLAP